MIRAVLCAHSVQFHVLKKKKKKSVVFSYSMKCSRFRLVVKMPKFDGVLLFNIHLMKFHLHAYNNNMYICDAGQH